MIRLVVTLFHYVSLYFRIFTAVTLYRFISRKCNVEKSEIQFPLFRKDIQYVWCLAVISPIRNSNYEDFIYTEEGGPLGRNDYRS